MTGQSAGQPRHRPPQECRATEALLGVSPRAFKDPLTAHGITDALRDADGLARAVAEGGEDALARYEEERDEASLELFELSDRIASFAWDLDEIRRLHRELSEAMNRELAALVARDGNHRLAA